MLFLVNNDAFSKITITFVSNIAVDKHFPRFTVELKAEQDGTPVEITKENLLIQEVNYTNSPDSIIKTQNNTYIVKWKSNLTSKSSIAYFYLTHGKEVGYEESEYPVLGELPILKTIQINHPTSGIPILFFKSKYNGDPDTLGLYLKTNSNLDIVIDSVVFDSPSDFKYELLAPIGTKCPFELKDIHGFFIIFFGKEKRLYQDKITFYYNGGQTLSLDLVANSYRAQTKTSLVITNPKPGDTLTPCIADTIKWIGGMPGATTFIKYSSNNGTTWDILDQTDDSLWVGVISNKPTEQGLLMIYQEFKKSPENTLQIDKGYNKIKFTNTAEYLIASTNDAQILEWKIDQSGAQQKPTRSGQPSSIANYYEQYEYGTMVALTYTKDDIASGKREFAAIYTPYPQKLEPYARFDSLYYFNNLSVNPVKSIRLKYRVRQAESDPRNRWLAVLPKLSNKIDFFSSDTKTIDYEFVAKAPIRRFIFSSGGDSLIIALQNNVIEVYDISGGLSTPILKNTLEFSSKPLIDRIAYSPDGRFLAFSTVFPPDDQPNQSNLLQTSRTHVYEVATNIMINSYFGENSEALGVNFNPSSSRLVRASQKPEHIMMYDLSLALDNDYFTIDGSDLFTYDFATEGHNIGAISTNGELHLHKFVYTESDVIDGVFKIKYPTVSIDSIVLPDRYIDTELDTSSIHNLCNTGNLPFIINSIEFANDRNFKISRFTPQDTIYPHECFDFGYVFNPIDTGLIVDTLLVHTCVQTFKIAFKSKGLPRNLKYYDEEYNFGDVCLTKFKDKKVKLFRNIDPVPLRINAVLFKTENNSGFFVMSNYDTLVIVQPDEDYFVDVRFTPKKRGINTGDCIIKHSNQGYMIPQITFKGFGLGSDVAFSPTQLRFIPEIPIRKFKIQNLENTPITIEGYQFSVQNAYKVISPIGQKTIDPKGEIEIEVQCLTPEAAQYAELELVAIPCLANSKFQLNKYSGESIIQVEDTEADPRGNAVIKIIASSKENNPYQGVRFFEGELVINQGIFIANTEQAIKSEYGNGELLDQTINDGKRKITFRVEGDFPMEGVIAEIHGLAGLTNPPSSPIELLPTSQLFGKNITTVSKPGLFKLINLCEDKYLYNQNTIISVKSIAPNPVQDVINLKIDSKLDAHFKIEIYNSMGVLVKEIGNITIKSGENSIPIDSHLLNNGQYRGVIKGNSIESVFSFIVLKY